MGSTDPRPDSPPESLTYLLTKLAERVGPDRGLPPLGLIRLAEQICSAAGFTPTTEAVDDAHRALSLLYGVAAPTPDQLATIVRHAANGELPACLVQREVNGMHGEVAEVAKQIFRAIRVDLSSVPILRLNEVIYAAVEAGVAHGVRKAMGADTPDGEALRLARTAFAPDVPTVAELPGRIEGLIAAEKAARSADVERNRTNAVARAAQEGLLKMQAERDEAVARANKAEVDLAKFVQAQGEEVVAEMLPFANISISNIAHAAWLCGYHPGDNPMEVFKRAATRASEWQEIEAVLAGRMKRLDAADGGKRTLLDTVKGLPGIDAKDFAAMTQARDTAVADAAHYREKLAAAERDIADISRAYFEAGLGPSPASAAAVSTALAGIAVMKRDLEDAKAAAPAAGEAGMRSIFQQAMPAGYQLAYSSHAAQTWWGWKRDGETSRELLRPWDAVVNAWENKLRGEALPRAATATRDRVESLEHAMNCLGWDGESDPIAWAHAQREKHADQPEAATPRTPDILTIARACLPDGDIGTGDANGQPFYFHAVEQTYGPKYARPEQVVQMAWKTHMEGAAVQAEQIREAVEWCTVNAGRGLAAELAQDAAHRLLAKVQEGLSRPNPLRWTIAHALHIGAETAVAWADGERSRLVSAHLRRQDESSAPPPVDKVAEPFDVRTTLERLAADPSVDPPTRVRACEALRGFGPPKHSRDLEWLRVLYGRIIDAPKLHSNLSGVRLAQVSSEPTVAMDLYQRTKQRAEEAEALLGTPRGSLSFGHKGVTFTVYGSQAAITALGDAFAHTKPTTPG